MGGASKRLLNVFSFEHLPDIFIPVLSSVNLHIIHVYEPCFLVFLALARCTQLTAAFTWGQMATAQYIEVPQD